MLGFTRSASPPRPAAAPTLAAAPALPLDLPEIVSAEQYEAISVPASDLVANGRACKFLLDWRRPEAPGVHFVNANFEEDGEIPEAARYHYFFARAALGVPEGLEEFNRITYFTEGTKRYVAGVVHTYVLEGSGEPVYGLQFYPQDVISERLVLDAVRQVREKITLPGARFAFVATGTQQTVATVSAELAAAGIESLTIDRILGSIRYIPLHRGEAWGYLRIFPKDNNSLAPTDIPVFDELPLDLSVVAGVLTRAVQDANSHVNLKSKERNTPNMVLRDASPDHPRLAPWADKPVHFVVQRDDFLLEETSPEQVAAKLAERMSLPWIPLVWEPETRLLSYAEMAAGSPSETLAFSKRYGSKAANLGFLTHRRVLGRTVDAGTPSQVLGYDLVPTGFGVPLQHYRDLVDYEPNGDLREKLAALIEAEKAGTLSGNERARHVGEVQTAFLNARFPPETLKRIKAKLQEILPGVKKIKVRSSANAEDIPNFDGAGLHDSFSATVSKKDNEDESCRIEVEDEDGSEVKRKVLPKSVACAIKGVYASLWNQRAIEERSFARIDHDTVAMGIAIVAAYDNESDVAANAVVITRVLNTRDVFGYSLSVQEGNNLVTNPDPGTYSEVTVAALGASGEPTSLTITRYAKPAPDRPERTTPVLSREQMLTLVDLAGTTEVAYCRAKPSYSEGRDCGFIPLDSEKPKSLDMEMKILEDGRFICKQVREFGGR
ncbi:MAG TPA: PEP/pyruvate-binding domain-containing protein [Thermoanaerobaculia bacterium]|nr:PEP/pyruvate-binding domain-containing protein [Thermoanaerobaculia bacterium]